ncbi:MAG TPA: inorganic phosphate transporter, partial [Acidobacteriota bacterium]|nr:inorganic phosphate transporter [Acidobacteriota bacterium]
MSLLIACGFEFVNGFHDTANAVATVIYTNTLKPWIAVIWSGLCNFAGVLLGGISVAMGIIYLLPSELLVNKGTGAGLAMVMALLLAAILWNLGTWYYGLPASSSHTLIGAILGVGLANSMLPGHTFGDGVNWGKATEIGLSLLVSPLTGFSVAFLLLWLSKKLIPNEKLYTVPTEAEPPPLWIRLILIVTCTGVSFAHGSNDGQKGVGLIMLILIGILPASYALNATLTQTQLTQTVEAARQLDLVLQRYDDSKPLLQIGFAPDSSGTPTPNTPTLGTPISNLRAELADIQTVLAGKNSVKEIAKDSRWTVRKDILLVVSSLTKLEKGGKIKFSEEDSKLVKKNLSVLRG